MYVYLSLGSNLEVQKNAFLMVKHLLHHFSELTIWPFVETAPVGMRSKHIFVNSVVAIQTDLNEAEIKSITNQIEEGMGRDRSASDCKIRDRAADIDILFQHKQLNFDWLSRWHEPYVQAVASATSSVVPISNLLLPTDKRASTVYFDVATGQIRVINDVENRL